MPFPKFVYFDRSVGVPIGTESQAQLNHSFTSSLSSSSSSSSPYGFNESTISIKPTKPKRNYVISKSKEYSRHSSSQVELLEQVFQKQKYMKGETRKRVAKLVGITEMQVTNWFQNRRAKEKSFHESQQKKEKSKKKKRRNSLSSTQSLASTSSTISLDSVFDQSMIQVEEEVPKESSWEEFMESFAKQFRETYLKNNNNSNAVNLAEPEASVSPVIQVDLPTVQTHAHAQPLQPYPRVCMVSGCDSLVCAESDEEDHLMDGHSFDPSKRAQLKLKCKWCPKKFKRYHLLKSHCQLFHFGS